MKTLPLQELKTFHKNSLVIKGQIQYDLMSFWNVQENTYFSINPIIFSKEFSVDQRLLDCMKISAVFVALYLKEIVQKKKS